MKIVTALLLLIIALSFPTLPCIGRTHARVTLINVQTGLILLQEVDNKDFCDISVQVLHALLACIVETSLGARPFTREAGRG